MSNEQQAHTDTSPLIWLVPAVLLLGALAPWPYGYYVFMRIVVCGAAAFLAWQAWDHENRLSAWAVSLIVLSVLFNPIVPVHLSREIWAPIDVAAAIGFGIHYFKFRHGQDAKG